MNSIKKEEGKRGKNLLVLYLDDSLVINFSLLVDWSSMDLEDLEPTLLVWQRNLNLSVETTWSKKGWVERIRSVGRHDELGSAEGVEAVHLVEELDQTATDK